jgi:4-hydroxy-tetrahydrodipicolinate reductase
MIKIGINGANGKMGQEIRQLIPEFSNCQLVYSRSKNIGSLQELCLSSDVILDFSSIEGSMEILGAAITNNRKLLIGTTGFSDEQHRVILEASKKIPILQTANTSFGIALLNILVKKAAATLIGYDVEIIEKHHVSKKDSPSGTALMLKRNIADSSCDIKFESIRGNDVTFEHQVNFSNQAERIGLIHKAETRRVFAQGAIKAAIWLFRCNSAGLYNMEDVLREVM